MCAGGLIYVWGGVMIETGLANILITLVAVCGGIAILIIALGRAGDI